MNHRTYPLSRRFGDDEIVGSITIKNEFIEPLCKRLIDINTSYIDQGPEGGLKIIEFNLTAFPKNEMISKKKVREAIDKIFDVNDDEHEVHNIMIKKELGLWVNTSHQL